MYFRVIWKWIGPALLIPYFMTLFWGGDWNGTWSEMVLDSQRLEAFHSSDGDETAASVEFHKSWGRVYLDKEEKHYVDGETYLIGVVVCQMDPQCEMEALKAQAVLGRTFLYKKMDRDGRVKQSELGISLDRQSQLEKIWGKDGFAIAYERVKQAVEETAGQILTYEGVPVEPFFHKISAGVTRAGEEPYLVSVESKQDMEAEGYETVREWKEETYGEIQMISRDEAGYVEEIQIGGQVYTGDEAMELLQLPSPAFTISHLEGGRVEAVCHGVGHGIGLSQYGAEKLAEEGYGAEAILGYYFKNVEVISLDRV